MENIQPDLDKAEAVNKTIQEFETSGDPLLSDPDLLEVVKDLNANSGFLVGRGNKRLEISEILEGIAGYAKGETNLKSLPLVAIQPSGNFEDTGESYDLKRVLYKRTVETSKGAIDSNFQLLAGDEYDLSINSPCSEGAVWFSQKTPRVAKRLEVDAKGNLASKNVSDEAKEGSESVELRHFDPDAVGADPGKMVDQIVFMRAQVVENSRDPENVFLMTRNEVVVYESASALNKHEAEIHLNSGMERELVVGFKRPNENDGFVETKREKLAPAVPSESDLPVVPEYVESVKPIEEEKPKHPIYQHPAVVELMEQIDRVGSLKLIEDGRPRQLTKKQFEARIDFFVNSGDASNVLLEAVRKTIIRALIESSQPTVRENSVQIQSRVMEASKEMVMSIEPKQEKVGILSGVARILGREKEKTTPVSFGNVAFSFNSEGLVNPPKNGQPNNRMLDADLVDFDHNAMCSVAREGGDAWVPEVSFFSELPESEYKKSSPGLTAAQTLFWSGTVEANKRLLTGAKKETSPIPATFVMTKDGKKIPLV